MVAFIVKRILALASTDSTVSGVDIAPTRGRTWYVDLVAYLALACDVGASQPTASIPFHAQLSLYTKHPAGQWTGPLFCLLTSREQKQITLSSALLPLAHQTNGDP